MTGGELEALAGLFRDRRHEFEIFRRGVVDYFSLFPELNAPPFPVIHSIKSRLKDPAHLRDKIVRKLKDGPITPENFFQRVTDLTGVRVMHLHQKQVVPIHNAIQARIVAKDWVLHEPPTAYSWDPESRALYEGLPVRTEIKESYYTSVHYLVRPRADSPVCCEIQVRTLFEEAWGEIDHAINYPTPTQSVACREQLRVLARLVSTGTRLADAIFRTWEDHVVAWANAGDKGPPGAPAGPPPPAEPLAARADAGDQGRPGAPAGPVPAAEPLNHAPGAGTRQT